jgi:hypothetical protein
MMVIVKDVVLYVTAGALLVVAGALIWAGTYEMLLGRRVPGFLGREYFRSTAGSWTPGQWRKNGYVIAGLGLGFLVTALWIVSFTFR